MTFHCLGFIITLKKTGLMAGFCQLAGCHDYTQYNWLDVTMSSEPIEAPERHIEGGKNCGSLWFTTKTGWQTWKTAGQWICRCRKIHICVIFFHLLLFWGSGKIQCFPYAVFLQVFLFDFFNENKKTNFSCIIFFLISLTWNPLFGTQKFEWY